MYEDEDNMGVVPPDKIRYDKVKPDKPQKHGKKGKRNHSGKYTYNVEIDLTVIFQQLYNDNLRMAEELGKYRAMPSEPEPDTIVSVKESGEQYNG